MSSHGHAFTISDGVARVPIPRPRAHKRLLVAGLSCSVLLTLAYDLLLLAIGLR